MDPQWRFLKSSHLATTHSSPLVGSGVSGVTVCLSVASVFHLSFFTALNRIVRNVHVEACREQLMPSDPRPHLWNEDTIRFVLQHRCDLSLKTLKEPLIVRFHPRDRPFSTDRGAMWHNLSFSCPHHLHCSVQSFWWNERSVSMSFLP